MKCDLGNNYAYFSEEIDDQFPEPLLGELDIHVFVNTNRGHDKFTSRSIIRLF